MTLIIFVNLLIQSERFPNLEINSAINSYMFSYVTNKFRCISCLSRLDFFFNKTPKNNYWNILYWIRSFIIHANPHRKTFVWLAINVTRILYTSHNNNNDNNNNHQENKTTRFLIIRWVHSNSKKKYYPVITINN